jgi:hypothetical protein
MSPPEDDRLFGAPAAGPGRTPVSTETDIEQVTDATWKA